MGMKIEMMFTEKAAPDGIRIEMYEKGKVYEVGETITQEIADIFLKGRCARVFEEPKINNSEKMVKEDEKEIKAFKKPPKDK